MAEWYFTALGTEWHITIDTDESTVSDALQQKILLATEAFNAQFSRFQAESEVCSFRDKAPGTYPISPELAQILRTADTLREISHGGYDPAVGTLLEHAGYDQNYSLRPQQEKLATWQLPGWTVDPTKPSIQITDSVVFDIGGMGKGYWIDRVSELIAQAGYTSYIVEGGGDMYATQKADDSAWKIALEMPGQPDTAIGVLELKHQGFAASDTFRRRWGDWNHLLQGKEKRAITHLLGCMAIAPTAWLADQATAVLPHLETAEYPVVTQELQAEYLVILADGSGHVSKNWPGELFSRS